MNKEPRWISGAQIQVLLVCITSKTLKFKHNFHDNNSLCIDCAVYQSNTSEYRVESFIIHHPHHHYPQAELVRILRPCHGEPSAKTSIKNRFRSLSLVLFAKLGNHCQIDTVIIMAQAGDPLVYCDPTKMSESFEPIHSFWWLLLTLHPKISCIGKHWFPPNQKYLQGKSSNECSNQKRLLFRWCEAFQLLNPCSFPFFEEGAPLNRLLINLLKHQTTLATTTKLGAPQGPRSASHRQNQGQGRKVEPWPQRNWKSRRLLSKSETPHACTIKIIKSVSWRTWLVYCGFGVPGGPISLPFKKRLHSDPMKDCIHSLEFFVGIKQEYYTNARFTRFTTWAMPAQAVA